jgi:hypothetical protein
MPVPGKNSRIEILKKHVSQERNLFDYCQGIGEAARPGRLPVVEYGICIL